MFAKHLSRAAWCNAFLLAVVVLAASSCSKKVKEAPAPPPPPPAPIEAPSAPPFRVEYADFRLARAFAGPSTVIEPVPTAVLLLSRQAEKLRNELVCDAFLSLPDANDLRSQTLVDPNIIATRMLLSTDTPSPEELASCRSLLEIYDYERSAALISRFGLEGSGPFFVVIFPSNTAEGTTPILALDASPLAGSELLGFGQAWHKALSMASTLLPKPPEALESPAPASTPDQATPATCRYAGELAKVVAPVAIAIGTGMAAEYPAVGIVLGVLENKDPKGTILTYLKSTLGGIPDAVGQGTTAGCSWLVSKFRQWFKRPATQPD